MELDDDPVVREIPVFLSKPVTDKLFVFQYPLQQKKEDNSNVVMSCIKPENQEVRMELALDVKSAIYNKSMGEQIARNIDGTGKDHPVKGEQDTDKIMFPEGLMDKIVYHSTRALPDSSNFAIGHFQDNEFHITPIKGVVQLRPIFNYLDKAEKRKEDGKSNAGEDTDHEDEEAKAVTVTFARQESDYFKKMRERSFQHHAEKSEEEQWISTQYHPSNSSLAEVARIQMFSSAHEGSGTFGLNLSKNQYYEMLTQLPKDTSSSPVQAQPLLDQIRTILRKGNIMSFTHLRSIIKNEHSTPSILKYLQQVAVLVQGNWAVNSELLYPKDTVSTESGIPAELMCKARDYILLSFTQDTYVDRKAVSPLVKLPINEITAILKDLAKCEGKKGWRLKVAPDKEFLERYPEIVQRQEAFWEAKRKHLREMMANQQHHAPQRQRRKSNRESISLSESEEKIIHTSPRGRKTKESSQNDSATNDTVNEPVNLSGGKHKKNRTRKISETV